MTKPIRVCFGITELNVGGAEKSLVELVTRLDRERFLPSVVSLMPRGPLADVLAARSVPAESLEMTSAWQFPRSLSRWRKILLRNQVDVLVTFLFHANILGRFAAWGIGIPHVSGVRVAERQAGWHLAVDRWTRSLTERYVCVSQAVADLVTERVRGPNQTVQVIGNGVDVAVADSAHPLSAGAWPVPERVPALVCLGRLDRQKGPDIAIEAMNRYRTISPQGRAHLVFVGDGPMGGECRRQVISFGLEERVHFVGPQPDPYAWLLRADGLVQASRWEGMPNAVLEAMAARRCVIATKVDGNVELVRHGQTGWLVESEQLAEAIVEWEADANRRGAFGQTGRERVEADFSIDATVKKWEAVLFELARRKLGD